MHVTIFTILLSSGDTRFDQHSCYTHWSTCTSWEILRYQPVSLYNYYYEYQLTGMVSILVIIDQIYIN